MSMWRQYRSLGKNLKAHSEAFGSIWGNFGSPYFHGAALLTGICYPRWWGGAGWWDDPKAVLPNLFGFTLGAYALLVSFSDQEFRALIIGARKVEGELKPRQSPFLSISAAFAHYLFVQAAALLWAIAAQGLSTMPEVVPLGALRPVLARTAWGIGYLLFLYALTLTLAAVIQVFRLSVTYDRFLTKLNGGDDDKRPPEP